MKRILRLLASLVAMASPLAAQSYLVSSPGPGSVYSNATTDTVYPIGYYNLGYEFTVGSSALSVSALGLWDAGSDGFNYSHAVGLWDTAGTLLATVTLPSGSNTLVNGFAFAPITSVTLAANTNYILGAEWSALAMMPQDAVHFNPNGSSPLLTGATLVGDRYGNFGNAPAGLSFPNGSDWSSANTGAVSGFTNPPLVGGAGASFIGANLAYSAVPEPSTYAMFAGLGVLGFAAWRRRGGKKVLAV